MKRNAQAVEPLFLTDDGGFSAPLTNLHPTG